jgi:hypothetical protein
MSIFAKTAKGEKSAQLQLNQFSFLYRFAVFVIYSGIIVWRANNPSDCMNETRECTKPCIPKMEKQPGVGKGLYDVKPRAK